MQVSIVANRSDGEIAFCNIIYDNNFRKFEDNYLQATKYCWEHYVMNIKTQVADNKCILVDEKEL